MSSFTSASKPEPLYVCVHVPEFPAQTLVRLRPELAGAPVVVLAGNPPLQQACSLSTPAGRLGVTRGMTRAELDMFAGLVLLPRSEPEQGNTRAALLESAWSFTPRVEVQAAASAQAAFSMVLDMTGTTRIFGSPQQAVASIARSVSALRLYARMAASVSFHAALCMAPFALKTPIIIPPGCEDKLLHSLPLSALPLTEAQTETFALWGLHTLGELGELDEVALTVRLGQVGKQLRQMARGEQPHQMVPEEPAFALDEFLGFDSPVELLDSLLFVLGPMLDQLLTRAQYRAFALASIALTLKLDGGGEHRRTIKPALPLAQRDVLLKLIHLDLQAHPPSAGVLSIAVHAEPGDCSKVQLGMFMPPLPEAVRLDITLARIAALVGEERVGYGRLLDTHRPDSFVMERFLVPNGPASLRTKPEAALAPIALRRSRPPLQVSVRHEKLRPAAFSWNGKHYTIREAYGPWRQSGDWWTATAWSYEEWDVYATAGTQETLLCILSRNLLSHQWQVKAVYD